MSLAEKFQITLPPKKDIPDQWVTAQSQHINTGHDVQMNPDHGEKFNIMPVGYDATCSRDKFVYGFGGDTDVSDGMNPKAMMRGYNRVPMKGTDDQYSGEHIDLFYGEAEDEDGNVGFVERNNMLDRL